MSGARFALMAGGGTAGHLQPALAIADALVERGHDRGSIEFVGSRRGQDRAVLAGRGFPFTLLPGRGIVRRTRPRDLAGNALACLELGAAVVRGFGVLLRARPRVVVSAGGYASVPASLAAVVLGVPLVLVNVDAVPGAANRLFGRFARACAAGWDGTDLPRSVVTGTPLPPGIAGLGRTSADRRRARSELGLPPDRATVVAFGGSLGARRINQAVAGMVERWKGRTDRAVYHIVGRRDWDAAIATRAACRHRHEGRDPVVVSVPYEERMGTVYAAADVVVCRAGAMTVAELAAAGAPSVLVPLPGAPGDHQTANARVLERGGAAEVVPDAACDGERLAGTLDRLLADPERLSAMERSARALAHDDAADAGALLVEQQARAARRGDP